MNGVKQMLLGIAIIVAGGFVLLDTSTNIGGVPIMGIAAGLLVVVAGYLKKD